MHGNGAAMMRLLVVAVLVVALAAACTRQDLASPKDREAHWRSIMPLEVPVGASRSELVDWLDDREIDYSETARGEKSLMGADRSIVFNVEELAGDGWVCSVWLIRVRAILDDADAIERYEVDREGVCL